MIVLDASVLIGHLDPDDAHHREAEQVLLDGAADGLGISPLTLAEVLVGPVRAGTQDQTENLLRAMGLVLLELPGDAPRRLAELRVSTRLPLPDCGALLAAEQSGGALGTFDDGLAAAARARGLAVRGAMA